MNILLTGSNGFLGKFIYNYLIVSNKVFTLNRTNSNYNCDLSKSITHLNNSFDLVIHCAGLAHINNYKRNDNSFYKVNVNGTNNLLKSLQEKIPNYFIYISSVSVYGLIQGININEQQPLQALDPYGLSKILAEDKVIRWCKKNNVKYTILRLPLVVGTNPPGNLGSMINGIKKGYYFNIRRGTAKKSIVLAEDIAKFILKAAEVGGTYNLTDGYHPNFKELSHLISLQFGKTFVPNLPFFIAKLLAFFGDVIGPKFPFNSNKLVKITSTLTFNDEKARKAFGWNPTPVSEGFKIN